MPDQADQRRLALEKANESRFRRARLKQDLKHGRVSPRDVLLNPDPPEWLLSAEVWKIIVATNGLGPSKLKRAFAQARVRPEATFRSTGTAQRAAIDAALHQVSSVYRDIVLRSVAHPTKEVPDGTPDRDADDRQGPATTPDARHEAEHDRAAPDQGGLRRPAEVRPRHRFA